MDSKKLLRDHAIGAMQRAVISLDVAAKSWAVLADEDDLRQACAEKSAELTELIKHAQGDQNDRK